MVKEGKRISEISKELDIPKSTITTWEIRQVIALSCFYIIYATFSFRSSERIILMKFDNFGSDLKKDR